jgi:hypothetical protein
MRRALLAASVIFLIGYLGLVAVEDVNNDLRALPAPVDVVDLPPPMEATWDDHPPPTAPPSTSTSRGPAAGRCASSCGAGVDPNRVPGVLRSTAYCLTGTMASGRPTYIGAVASNAYALGTRLTVWPNPFDDPGMVFTVEDRHATSDANGYPTELDFAIPGECRRALAWGNTIRVTAEVVG